MIFDTPEHRPSEVEPEAPSEGETSSGESDAPAVTDLWFAEIDSRMIRAADALDNAHQAAVVINALTAIDHRPAEIKTEGTIVSVLAAWIDELCTEATASLPREGHLKITPDKLSSGAQLIPFRESLAGAPELGGEPVYDVAPTVLARAVLARLDLGKLEREIRALGQDLDTMAFRDAADQLGSLFDLTAGCGWRGDQTTKLRRVKGCIVLKFSEYQDSAWQRSEQAYRRARLALSFERESVVAGLSRTFMNISAAEESMRGPAHAYGARVPSRTRTEPVSGAFAVFFKDSTSLHLPEATFEALVAFVRDYAKLPVRTIEIS